MPVSRAKHLANTKWNKENLVRVAMDVKPEVRDAWREYAESIGLPLTTMIKRAIKEKMERDGIE